MGVHLPFGRYPSHPYPVKAGKPGNPRYANGHRRRELRKRIAALGLPCAICGKPIDYSLPCGDPMSYELDEVVPVSRGGSPTDPRNVQPSHRICNERKGAAFFAKDANGAKRAPAGRGGLPFSRKW